MQKIKLADKFGSFDETWVPKVIGELNGQYVKVAKFEGEYVWHKHDHEDELFLVIDGHVRIELRERTIELHPGELFIVPRGVEHRPVAPALSQVLMFEPASTRNTGNVDHDYTIEAEDLEHI